MFDDSTLKLLRSLLDRGRLTRILGPVSTGKEAIVLLAESREGECALKIYRLTPSFRTTKKYFSADPRYENPKISAMRSDRRSVVMQWARKEHHNLWTAEEMGLPVPRPFFVENNILAMEFLGKEGVPLPTLQKATGTLRDLGDEGIDEIWQKMLRYLSMMRKHGFVHGDLSAYNLLWDEETNSVHFIDISQSYVSREIETEELFRSDISNIATYFRRLGIETSPDELYDAIVGKVETPRRTPEIEDHGLGVEARTQLFIPARSITRMVADQRILRELEQRAGAAIKLGVKGSLLSIESRSPEAVEAAKKVFDATSRGFPYPVALRLAYSDVQMESVHARAALGSKKKARRQIGRLIGRDGSVKEAIEKYSGASICVRGSSINVIGTDVQRQLARRAIGNIISGEPQEVSILFLKEYSNEHYFEVHPF